MKVDGWASLSVEGKIVSECDTRTCAHCNSIIHLPKGKFEQQADFCRGCMKVICLKSACRTCTPFLKKLERWEARHQARRSYGIE